jgi:hypothetical protein
LTQKLTGKVDKIEGKNMKIEELIGRINAIARGRNGVIHVEILHDADCPALLTRRMQDCTCTPEIREMNA